MGNLFSNNIKNIKQVENIYFIVYRVVKSFTARLAISSYSCIKTILTYEYDKIHEICFYVGFLNGL